MPSCDLRKLMISRDSVCSVDAFNIIVRIVMAQLYGIRMCPECPHCALSERPCMDIYGSNATPMGGSMGEADALTGAVESQTKEGVLHLHVFLYGQMAHQNKHLKEIAELFRRGVLSLDAFKKFHNTHQVRCVS